MPNCGPTCPKVKRDLKKLAAERKRALNGRAGPSLERSTELEEELHNYEYSDNEAPSKSICSRSAKSCKGTETPSRSLCSRSGKSFKNTVSDFEESDDESTGRRSERRQFTEVGEDSPRTKRRDRRRNREEYESDESNDYVSRSYRPCSSQCSSNKLNDETIKRKQNARQKDSDDHHANEGFNFFQDLCNCSSICFLKQLLKDTYIQKTIVSLGLIAVGIPLCYYLDGLEIPV